MTNQPVLLKATEAGIEANLRFPGQYFDEESNLSYNYFRSYQAGTGRYSQPDPIGLDAGINRFVYGAGQPTGRVDPSGQKSWAVDVGLGVAGAVIGSVSGAVSAAQKCASWEDIGWSAVGGAVGGAAAGVALGFGGTSVVGGAAGFSGDALGTYLSTGGFNFNDSATAGFLGGLSAVGGPGFSKLGVGSKLSASSMGIMSLMMNLKYNHDTGAVQEGCTCKKP